MNWLIDFLLHRGNDLSTYFLPHAYFFKRSILQLHQIPLWNPIQFTGLPYLADPQNFIFYPPNYAFVLLPVETAFILLLGLHFLWAGLGTYYFAKTHFKLPRWFAIFAALAFVFTPKIFSHLEAGHYTMLVAFSWLPWFFLVKNPIFMALIAAFMYYNYITIAFYALLFLCFYALYTKKLAARRYALAALIFLLLISPSFIAQLKFAPLSTRSLITYADVAQPIWSLKLFFQNLFFPFFLNHQQLSTERVLFPGLVIWFLAILGWWKYRHPSRWFFAGWLIFSLLFALGDRIPFFVFFYKYFPIIKWLRVTTRPWIITNLFLAIFAGLGLPKKSSAVYVLILLSFIDISLINYKIFQKPIPVDLTPASFYELINQNTKPPLRVYCTTGCFSLQKLGELGIWSLSGNNPIQSRQFVDALQLAAGYSYSQYSPALPPYQVFSAQPQPNARLMAALDTKYIASSYRLIDPGFRLIYQDGGYFLYTVQ